jgi:hypothetical protein
MSIRFSDMPVWLSFEVCATTTCAIVITNSQPCGNLSYVIRVCLRPSPIRGHSAPE